MNLKEWSHEEIAAYVGGELDKSAEVGIIPKEAKVLAVELNAESTKLTVLMDSGDKFEFHAMSD
jgi:hypothetical protein